MSTRSVSAQLSFDYGDLPKQDASALERHANAITKHVERIRKTTAESVVVIGEELKLAQERLANHGNGTFKKWCEQRCGFSFVTAYKSIAAANVFKDSKEYLPSFDASALYLLSSESCPEEVTEKAKELAEQGEVITHKRAKELLAEVTVDQGEPDSICDIDDIGPCSSDLLGAFEPIAESVKSLAKKFGAENVVTSLTLLRMELVNEYGIDD